MNTREILFLTAFSAALSCWTGCASSRVIENTRVPEIVITESGAITFNDERIEVAKIASAIKSAGFEHTQEVNILIPDKPDRSIMKAVSGELVRNGYTRTIFVKNRKASAVVPKK